MKQLPASIRIFVYPIIKLTGLALILSFAAAIGILWKQQAQAVSPVNNPTPASAPVLFPSAQATMVNPDVKLKLTFKDAPRVGTSGKIRIFDAADDRLVDTLDMSIPAGPTKAVDPAVRAKNYLAFPYPYARTKRPTNADTKPGTPSAGATPTSIAYQLTIIGGFTDGFHFYPITIDGNTATIHPHHDLLEYGKSYYVTIDPEVLSVPNDSFTGITGKNWRFTTKPASKAPKTNATKLTVSADGTGNFNTVQGAMDFVPDNSKKRITIKVKNGVYEEIVCHCHGSILLDSSWSGQSEFVHTANNGGHLLHIYRF